MQHCYLVLAQFELKADLLKAAQTAIQWCRVFHRYVYVCKSTVIDGEGS